MRRLLSLIAFLAGGFSTEVVRPLQCDLAPASRRTMPATARSRCRTGLALSGGDEGRRIQPSSL
ncbi:hypothetical protein PHO31112_03747 [Pandoraea horticolens]|uniref:Uncharacterized protein n=1 Tax=Pandoraea horticolens TaxID=2508298 RepID=A0A5E4XA15_9BURK|nr:hypothetical protein [Pandoraea horticolens]VVE33219.1 hypothetical protein PHO31112_03747 [Pandoraea horticolens]